jgi:ribonuclease P protein component
MKKDSLTKDKRIRNPDDFMRLKQKSIKFDTSTAIVYYVLRNSDSSSSNPNSPRLAISVSSKKANAVRRNLIKRIVRDKFRKCLKTPSLDVMVVSKFYLKNKTPMEISRKLKYFGQDLEFIFNSLENRKFAGKVH